MTSFAERKKVWLKVLRFPEQADKGVNVESGKGVVESGPQEKQGAIQSSWDIELFWKSFQLLWLVKQCLVTPVFVKHSQD